MSAIVRNCNGEEIVLSDADVVAMGTGASTHDTITSIDDPWIDLSTFKLLVWWHFYPEWAETLFSRMGKYFYSVVDELCHRRLQPLLEWMTLVDDGSQDVVDDRPFDARNENPLIRPGGEYYLMLDIPETVYADILNHDNVDGIDVGACFKLLEMQFPEYKPDWGVCLRILDRGGRSAPRWRLDQLFRTEIQGQIRRVDGVLYLAGIADTTWADPTWYFTSRHVGRKNPWEWGESDKHLTLAFKLVYGQFCIPCDEGYFPSGILILTAAINAGFVSVVRFVLDAAATVEALVRDLNEWSPSLLLTAVQWTGHQGEEVTAEICEMLLAFGASPHDSDHSGKTALHWASATGNVEICRILLEGGASANAQDDHGRTPLDLAHSRRRQKFEIGESDSEHSLQSHMICRTLVAAGASTGRSIHRPEHPS